VLRAGARGGHHLLSRPRSTLDELPDKRGPGVPQAGRVHALCALAQLRRYERRRRKADPGGVLIKLVVDQEAEPVSYQGCGHVPSDVFSQRLALVIRQDDVEDLRQSLP